VYHRYRSGFSSRKSERLEQLKKAKAGGLLTDEEFERKKEEALRSFQATAGK
jgi:hypothetical protein